MPERHGRLDLDDTFAQLVGTVELRTSPPGGDRAMRTARRRRTALAAAAAAVAVVVASALTAGFLAGGDRDASVAAPPTPTASTSAAEPDLYPPMPLTVERLNEASGDWVQWWSEGETDPPFDVESCVLRQLDKVVGSVGPDAETQFSGRDWVTAKLVRSRFETPVEAGRTMFAVHQEIEKCEDRGAGSHGYPPPDEVRQYEFGPDARRGTAWFVLAGDRLAVFTVLGAPNPDEDSETYSRLADVLYADLRAW